MAESLLRNKRFYCRENIMGKIKHCLESRRSARTCGVLLTGGPGSGKTAIATELVWPTVIYGKQTCLHEKLLAYHFCQTYNINSLSMGGFVERLLGQLRCSPHIPDFETKLLQNSTYNDCGTRSHPEKMFSDCILPTLNKINHPPDSLFIIIDSIDDSLYETFVDETIPRDKMTIANLISSYHHLFPPWLMLMCSCRKSSRSVARLFNGFRKICLDELRKNHVVRDTQQYILSRLDDDRCLRKHLSKETAEMLNHLHIKSNGCFLYIENVLNGVSENFIMLREISEIPGTLKGLYLWLCQRLFSSKHFDRVKSILNVILSTRYPRSPDFIYNCLLTKPEHANLTREDFNGRLKLLSRILVNGPNKSKLFFHHSFAEWLLDVKHCTQKYLCDASDGHGMLTMNFTCNGMKLSSTDVQEFAYHLLRSSKSQLDIQHLALWLLLSGADLDTCLSAAAPSNQTVLKLIETATVRQSVTPLVLTLTNENCFKGITDSVNFLPEHADIHQLLNDISLKSSPTAVESVTPNNDNKVFSQEVETDTEMNLYCAVREGNVPWVQRLLSTGVMVNEPDDEGWLPLRTAAWGGHFEIVNLLLRYGAEVDCSGTDGRTALRAASWGGHETIVQKLISAGADVNHVDEEGRTPLIAAAYMAHFDVVDRLINAGADVNHADKDGRTALSVACLCIPASENHLHVVNLLLECKAKVNHTDKDGISPLFVAAYEGHADVCELLLEWDADVDHTDFSNRTPLLAAASMGHAQVVNQLMYWGAAVDTIDDEGRTVLSIAAAHGCVKVINILLDRGLDEMHRDNAGWTPLHMAAFEGHAEVCDLLIQRGAKVNEIDNDGRHALLLAAQEGHPDAVSILLSHNASIDRRSHSGQTAFRAACLNGHKVIAQNLLSEGANCDYIDADGRSTLYICALENRVTSATFLLEMGAEPEKFDAEGRTALHVAAWQGHVEMVQLLLKYRAYVDSMDHEQRTALQSASWQGHANVARILLEHGAKVDHVCNQGATALCVAAQEGHENVAAILLEYNANPNHHDKHGRSPLKVARKGEHGNVIKLLEQRTSCPVTNTKWRLSSNVDHSVGNYINLVIGNGVHSSSSGSPNSTSDRRISVLSSSRSSILTSTNSSNNASSNCVANNIDPLTFTQQLQQCSASRNRPRPISRLLTPVHEPGSPFLSPASSPPTTPATDFTQSKLASNERVNFVTNSPIKLNGSKTEDINLLSKNGHTHSAEGLSSVSNSSIMNHSPNNGLCSRDLSPQTSTGHSPYNGLSSIDRSPQTIMGQSMLQNKCPDLKLKRNGIVTNPNFKKSSPTGSNEFVTKSFCQEKSPSLSSPNCDKHCVPLYANALPMKKETVL